MKRNRSHLPHQKLKKLQRHNENELETPGDKNSGGDKPIPPTPPKVMKTPEHHENKLELLKGDEESPPTSPKVMKTPDGDEKHIPTKQDDKNSGD